MNIPQNILIRLLAGEHLNVPERKALGLWPLEVLRYDELANCLAKALESQEWFPQSPNISEKGAPIREGLYIHRQTASRFVCIAQRTRASNPCVLAEQTETVFKYSLAAAEYYLKWELNLPGSLDGWTVL